MRFDINKVGPWIVSITSIITIVFLYYEFRREEKKNAIEIELQQKQLAQINDKLDAKLNKSL